MHHRTQRELCSIATLPRRLEYCPPHRRRAFLRHEPASLVLILTPLLVILDGLEDPHNVGAILRTADNLLRRVRDYAQVKHEGRITAEVADKALAMLEIDENGLDEMDKRILEAIIVKFGGGPVGVGSLAVAVGEEPDTLEEVYEPYLIMEGYLKRTSQGRVATELSYKKLGLRAAKDSQPTLL